MQAWMIGIDIGGTFTDVASTNVNTGQLHVTKVQSTPGDPSLAVIQGLERLFTEAPDITPDTVQFFAHGTTVATNALLQLSGARAGLLINRGFRALYELRGGTRPSGSDLIDTFYQKPAVLVPQKLTDEIGGRIAFDGSELEPLDEESVRTAARRLKPAGVDSIAICFLFSFMNPTHEQRAAEIVHEEHPACRVSLSSVVLPLVREYQRISTTVLDAYVGPVMESYLRRLADRLREAGLTTGQLFIMQSNGGLMRIDLAASYPNQTLLSGPAAGVVFGAEMGRITGERNVITFDMGGTSTDISVMPEGAYQETRQGQISGQDIGTPMIQIRTLGAGGGTIAWIGPDGLLKAGPRSAGADPGPACYGRGGELPTVTDANLVLGYLDPAGLVGGRVSLDLRLAEQSIQKHVAEPLGLSLRDAALGIIRVVNVNMEVGLRLSLSERGLDHRSFALVAFGGAGPLHATRVARNVGIPRVIVPPYPGISCAMGLLQTDVRHFYLRSRLAPLSALSADEMTHIFDKLEDRARAEAREEGFDVDALGLERQVDLRYPFQGYELTVPMETGPITEATRTLLREAFDAIHQQVYGTSAPQETPEVVNLRVVASNPVPRLNLPELERGEAPPASASVGSRSIILEEHADRQEVPVFRRERLLFGNIVEGPAVLEQLDSTTILLPGQRATVDRFGTLLIEVEAK
jgi:N-methylhydantoinase A